VLLTGVAQRRPVMSIAEFPAYARECWPSLRQALLDGSYQPAPLRSHADDVVILVGSQRSGQRVMASVARFLRRRLKLEVNVEKSQVVPTDQLAFLGFSFRGTKICWSAKTMARFGREVRRLTNRNWGVSMARRLAELERYLHLPAPGPRSSPCPTDGWHNRVLSPSRTFGSRLLIRGEPPSADPHAGWCG
jgi:hypothetical protein